MEIFKYIIFIGLLYNGLFVIMTVIKTIIEIITLFLPEKEEDPDYQINLALKDHDFTSGDSYCGEFRIR